MRHQSTTVRKAASIRPSNYVSGRDWRCELKMYIRPGKAEVHRGADGFPAYVRRALKIYAMRTGREFGETTAFALTRGAAIMLADPDVDVIRDSTDPIIDHGITEDQERLETFSYKVGAEDGVRRIDFHLTAEEIRPVYALSETLGLQIQTVLALACMHVLHEVPAVRRDWRQRMRAECAGYRVRLAERAQWAKEMAKRCRAKGARVS